MKVSQALKEKNRLAGEVKALFDIFMRENSRRSDNPSKIEIERIYKDWIAAKTALARIKGAIGRANINIYDKLAQLEELKNEMVSIESLPTREGKELINVWEDGKYVTREFEWKSFVNNEMKDSLKQQIQAKINRLQDEIDDYNNSTSIDIEK